MTTTYSARALRPHDFLISRERQRTDPAARKEAMTGEEAVLLNPLIEDANRAILDDYVPSRSRVIFSLCTKRRPYYDSVKWRTFVKRFGADADLVICSNGGIIPMPYARCFPFMEYDAYRDPKHRWDELYFQRMTERMTAFLERHGSAWEHVAHVYSHTSRNLVWLADNPQIPGARLITPQMGREVWEMPGMRYRMNALTAPQVLDAISDALALPREA